MKAFDEKQSIALQLGRNRVYAVSNHQDYYHLLFTVITNSQTLAVRHHQRKPMTITLRLRYTTGLKDARG